ncbi:hypothetical protein EW026_g6299 [Hermanssonia centrifuga]|uniref:Metallothionein n=1 Tax=Hermanssonia centrifuga TaxID=98765 RepID=A0A4V3X9S7_9APHY|nr:hypothetical protein EW026_g6299 [Hermanssonia centrifuga]
MFTTVAVPKNAQGCGSAACNCGATCQCKPGECKC